jgi:dipeptidase E
MRLLLGSGGLSTDARRRAWTDALAEFLGAVSEALFVPFALADHDAYLAAMTRRGFHGGKTLRGLHAERDPVAAVERAQAIYVGGGNTFRLLDRVQRLGVLDAMRARVVAGVPYVGISAGTNLACPTIRTTNDMPIVWPERAAALGLVPFQINPHYVAGSLYTRDVEWYVRYGGETRDDRLREFHEENDGPILALREGAILRVEGARATLAGVGGARLFEKGAGPKDLAPGADVSPLLGPAA